MKCVLLAAGYATRLYPLTRDLPKSLLPIGGGTILDFIAAKIGEVEGIDRIFLVTNDRFFAAFSDWAARHPSRQEITVLSDGTTTNENRLGALADLRFAIGSGGVDDDLLVMAGDNLFDFSLADFVVFFNRVGRDCITVHELTDPEALRRTGVVTVDALGRVTGFEEKPRQPKSQLAAPPFYLFRQETLPWIGKYLEEGNPPDAPGNFIPWLISRREVYAYRFAGHRYDIGDLDSYRRAVGIFAKPVKEEH